MCQLFVRSRLACFALAGLAMCMLSAPIGAVTIVDDHFDDSGPTSAASIAAMAAIGINPNGIGTGFNALPPAGGNGKYEELNSVVRLIHEADGGRRNAIASKDGAVLANGAATVLFDGLSFAANLLSGGGGNTDRIFLGVAGDATAGDFQSDPPTGFFVQIESNSIPTGTGNGSFGGTSSFFYESSTSTRTQLATWTFDTLDFTGADHAGVQTLSPILDLEITLDATGYSLSISGDTISNLTGGLSGTYAGAGITNELTAAHALAFSQNEVPNVGGNVPDIDVMIDRIVISQVPEPTSLLLLMVGGALSAAGCSRCRQG